MENDEIFVVVKGTISTLVRFEPHSFLSNILKKIQIQGFTMKRHPFTESFYLDRRYIRKRYQKIQIGKIQVGTG